MEYSPTESARQFHESRARVKAIWGPVGSGKSSAALWEFVLQAMESPVPIRGVVIRSSYRELMDTTRVTLFEWFGDFASYKEGDDDASITLPGPDGKMQTHTLHFRAIQRPEESTKLQSMEIAFAFMEECVPAFSTQGVMGGGLPKGIMDICLLRLRQRGAHRYTLVLSANPPPPTHWFHQQFIRPSAEELAERNTSVTFQPPYENSPNLPLGYYDDLRRRLDPDLVRRFIDGEIITMYDGEMVFPEAKDHVHVLDEELEPVSGAPLILGFDWGLTPATLITQVTPSQQWIWLRELQSLNVAADMHCEQLGRLMRDFYNGYEYRSWGDPAGQAKSQTDAKTCFAIAASKGFPMGAGLMDWASRKEAVKQRLSRMILGKPALVVSRQNCPIAAEALLGGYRYPKSRDGIVGYRPIKNMFSHLMDCAQYIATREFRILTKEAPVGTRPEDGYIVLKPLDPFRPAVRGYDSGEDDRTFLSN